MNKLSTFALQNCFANNTNKKKYNKDLFALIAPKYNWSTRILSLGQDQNWKNNLILSLPHLKKPVCLDVACGTGDVTFRIAKKYFNAKIYGLDITKEMIKKAIEFNKFSNVKFVCQDMCNTSFENNTFDIITGSYALRNAPNLQNTLTEIYRILKPQGTFAVLDFSKFDNKFAQKIQYYVLLYWGYLWGIILHRNHTTYGYIAESLYHYPTKNELEKLMQDFNFKIVKKQNFFFGMMQLLILKKI